LGVNQCLETFKFAPPNRDLVVNGVLGYNSRATRVFDRRSMRGFMWR